MLACLTQAVVGLKYNVKILGQKCCFLDFFGHKFSMRVKRMSPGFNLDLVLGRTKAIPIMLNKVSSFLLVFFFSILKELADLHDVVY